MSKYWTPKEFKKRRRKILKDFHPDHNGSTKESNETFKAIQAFLKWWESWVVKK